MTRPTKMRPMDFESMPSSQLNEDQNLARVRVRVRVRVGVGVGVGVGVRVRVRVSLGPKTSPFPKREKGLESCSSSAKGWSCNVVPVTTEVQPLSTRVCSCPCT